MKNNLLFYLLILINWQAIAQSPGSWVQKASFPSQSGPPSREGGVSFSIGNRGYIGIGQDGTSTRSDFWEYDPIFNTWTQKANFAGGPRYQAVGFSIGNKGYIGTGYGSSSQNSFGAQNDFWEYNPTINAWTQKANFEGMPRFAATGFSIGDKGYIGTGAGNSDVYSDFWEYDPNINTWTQKANFGGGARFWAIGFSIDTKGYVGTGNNESDFWEYDPTTNSWTQKASFGGGSRSRGIGFSLGNKGYMGIGSKNGIIQSDFWEYDPSSNVWIQKANFGGGARYIAIGTSINGKGYIGTGFDGNSVFNDFWEYNPNTDIWAQKPTFKDGSRYGDVGFNIGNKGYIGTGISDGVILNDFWEFDPASNLWTQKANFAGDPRYQAVGFSIGNKGYIGTGNTWLGETDDFWEYNPTTNIWTQKANFGGGARYAATGFNIGNKGYIGTGMGGNYGGKDFWEYNPDTDVWIQKADCGNSGRYYGTGFSINNKGYIGTGYNNGFLNDFWEYDPILDRWEQKADFGGSSRVQSTSFSINNKGYLGVGQSNSGPNNDFWQFDPIANIWTQKANFGGAARGSATGFSIGQKGYIGLGWSSGLSFNDFWEFEPGVNISTSIITPLVFCQDGTINVSFTIDGTFNSGNVFTAQLFDTAGNFSSPLNIGTLSSITSDTINATIPSNTPAGTGYRIRVISSSPSVVGTDNGSNLIINALPTAILTGTAAICPGDSANLSIALTGTSPWAITFTNGHSPVTVNNIVASPYVHSVSPTSSTSYYLTAVSDANCNNSSVNSIATVTVDNLLNTSANSWIQKLNISGGSRQGAVAFSIGSKGYIGTGHDGSSNRNDFWEYDPANNSWTQKANFAGQARNAATGFSIGGKGYIGTGNSSGYTNNNLNDFWEYNPVTNSWTQKADFAGGARFYATSFHIGSKGYIGTGQDNTETFRNDFWEYDPATNNWMQKADFAGGARNYATSFSIGSKGYIGTGFDGSNRKNDFWEYNPTSNSWTQKANFAGQPRQWATGFSISNKGYIGTGSGNSGILNDLWEYDPSIDEWLQKANFGGPGRAFSISFSIGSKGYIGTGNDFTNRFNDFWEYEPDLDLSTGAVASSSYCGGSFVSVPFKVDRKLYCDNEFIAQLSDTSGSFASPTILGSLAVNTSDTINVTIPTTTHPGTGYRIRLISSNPAATGADNGSDLTINALPTATLSGTDTICQGDSAYLSIALTGTGPWSISYTDSLTLVTVNDITNSPIQVAVAPTSDKTYILTAVSDANCSGSSFTGSAIVTLNSLPELTNPTIAPVNNEPGQCGASVSFAATATGSPTPVLRYFVNGDSISSPHFFPIGTTSVTAIATNSCGTDSTSFNVTVIAPLQANSMEIITSEDSAIAVNLSGSSQDSLTYAVINQPQHGVLSGQAPALIYTPAANYYGPDSFAFVTRYCQASSDTAYVSITVSAVNDAPELAAIGNKAVKAYSNLAFSISATDPDLPANQLWYTMISPPIGATLDSLTGAFNWVPTQSREGTHQVTFRVFDGGSPLMDDEETITITVEPLSPPQISSFTPSSGPIGTIVSISGSGFTGTTTVTINGFNSGFSILSDQSIEATIPVGATTGRIVVTGPGGIATSKTNFRVTYPKPAITSFSPGFGPIGSIVTITGSGFIGATDVKFNGTLAQFTVTNDFTVEATVPSGATTGKISITTPVGSVSSSGSFQVTSPAVIPTPVVSGFSPSKGPIGTLVTISGNYFSNTSAVSFNGANATSFQVINPTTITATVPAGATTGKISITTPGGTATSKQKFLVTVSAVKLAQTTTEKDLIKPQLVCYPNPTYGKTTIRYFLEHESNYTLDLYDVKGALVTTLKQGHAEGNQQQQYEFDSSKLKNGTYIIRLVSSNGIQTFKLIVYK